MLIKYFIPFVFSILVFSGFRFYPTGCDTDCSSPGSANPVLTDTELDSCFYNGIPLHGKVKFVESFPDFKVKFVSSFPDINVKFVSSFPDECGEWQIVESFPDFTIKVVESFPDVEIKVVESFPGLP